MFTALDSNQAPAENVWGIDQSENTIQSESPYRVLLVDDDAQTCQLLKDILGVREDITIVGRASDGKEAVAMALLHRPDVVLMDTNLPFHDGVEATYSMKQTNPGTVIIGLTENFNPAIYSAMRTAGAAGVVCKGELLSIHEMILYALRHAMNDLAIHNNRHVPTLQCAHCGRAFRDYQSGAVLVSHGICQTCTEYFRYRNQLRRDHARVAVFTHLNQRGFKWRPFMKSCLSHVSRSLAPLPRQWFLAYGKLFKVPSSLSSTRAK